MWQQIETDSWHNTETRLLVRRLSPKLDATYFPSGIKIGYVDERSERLGNGQSLLEITQKAADWQAQPDNCKRIIERMIEQYPAYSDVSEADFLRPQVGNWAIGLKDLLD